MTSNIKKFYANKTLLITGASGFLGQCLLEKILRTIPDHGPIYLLMRAKRGKQIGERLDELKRNPIFDTLLATKSVEQCFAQVHAIAGDVGEDMLALSPADLKLLTDQVNVIVHSAATLDFGDSLKTTVNINLLGTRRVVELAKQCRHLDVLVHVSSAYVNSYLLDTAEVLYDLPVASGGSISNADDLIDFVTKNTDEIVDGKTEEILGQHPNTYTITKHFGEHEIKKVESLFPCTIVRPSMIVGAWREPTPGWTSSKNGPQGFLMGAAKGVIRRLPVAKHLIYDYIPVDIVVNNLLAAGAHAAITHTKSVEIYHCTSSTRNPFNWSLIEDRINGYLHEFPLKSAVWYPYLKFLPSVTWYRISSFFVHMIPAFFLDTVTRLAGGRPILVKLHRNVNSSLDRLDKFIFTEWKFDASKTIELHKSLSKTDQQDYNLDIGDLIWSDYFRDLSLGARIYLNKEPLKTLSAAKGKDRILLVSNLFFQATLFSLIWYLFACLLGTSMSSAVFIVPIVYVLFNLL